MNYIYKIDNYEILSKDEEIKLLKNWLENSCIKSRNKLILHNMKFIIKVANMFRSKYSHVRLVDLIGYAVVGFIKGLSKVDINEISNEKGLRMCTYVVYWVMQNIQRGAEDNESIIRLPANIHENLRKKISNKNDLDENEKVFIENYKGLHRTHDSIGTDDSGLTLLEKYAYLNYNIDEQPDNILMKKEKINKVYSLINDLNQIEKEILINIYGLCNCEQMNLRNLGYKLNISHEQVRKIRNMAIQKLNKKVKLVEI